MPEVRNYLVRQTREVKVRANSAEEAVRIASAAFEHGQNMHNGVATGKGPEGIWGNTYSKIRDTTIYAEEQQ